jgi:hypothetical protein
MAWLKDKVQKTMSDAADEWKKRKCARDGAGT